MKHLEDWLTPGAIFAIAVVYFLFVMLPVILMDAGVR